MRSQHEPIDPLQTSSYRELQILSEIEGNGEVTQRQLSRKLGIALGLTNVMIRNLAQKGYVRATQAGWKRWIYALTPDGFTHKFRLTVDYVHRVLDHYATVRQTLRDQLESLALNEESRVAVYGTGEYAELVYLGLKEIGIEEIDFFESTEPDNRRFLGMTIHALRTLQSDKYDRVVVASLSRLEVACWELRGQGVSPEKMVTFYPDGVVKEARWDQDGT